MVPRSDNVSALHTPGRRVQKGNLMQKVQTDPTAQSHPRAEQQGPFQEPSTELPTSSTGTDARELASVIQEMDHLRARMAEIADRRDEETQSDRNSILATLALSDNDYHSSSPPAYSDVEKC